MIPKNSFINIGPFLCKRTEHLHSYKKADYNGTRTGGVNERNARYFFQNFDFKSFTI